MKRKVSGMTTQKYLQHKFLHVILATLGFVLLPIFLLFLVQWVNGKVMTEYIPAKDRLQPVYTAIKMDDIVASGGGGMVVNKQYEVFELGGKPVCDKKHFSEEEWTEFLVSTGNNTKYQYDIAYDEEGEYWLVLRKPYPILFSIVFDYNQEATGFEEVRVIFFTIWTLYLVALIGFVVIYSKIESAKMTKSIEEIVSYAEKMENGEYSMDMNEDSTLEINRLKAVIEHLAKELSNKEEIQRKEEAKRMLLVSEISHDLKNPLASVQGYSEMLCNTGRMLDAKQKEYAQIIYNNSVRANELLQSLFTYSKLGSAGFAPQLKIIDICEYTRRIFAEYFSGFEEAGFKYELNIPEEEIYVNLDTNLFRCVYDNMIQNAMKYNDNEITIRIRIRRSEFIEIYISDDGIGIDDRHAEQLFDPFFRVDGNIRNSKTGGSGLGLAIVKQVVILHSGSIEYLYNQKPGCGFRITLPII